MRPVRASAAPSEPSGFDLNLKFDGNLLTGRKDFRKAFGQPTSLENDVLNLAAAVFAVDLAAKREEREAFVRNLDLVVHVANIQAFRHTRRDLEYILGYLSSDNWTLTFEPDGNAPEKTQSRKSSDGTTILFSGGLDSFVAVADLLTSSTVPFLVSHVTGNRIIARAQDQLYQYLTKSFATQIPRVTFRVSGRKNRGLSFPRDHEREDTQRTRSFLFLALASLVARVSGHDKIVVMAENGQMAINAPLTAARVGPFSTHTAHPEFLDLAEGFFSSVLSHKLTFVNPYLYLTKGEVISKLAPVHHHMIGTCISCWRASRVVQDTHCGECIPCLVRRIALEHHGIQLSEYARDLFSEQIGELDPRELGKRNLSELMEFAKRCSAFSPNNSEVVVEQFPELQNDRINLMQALKMYKRFGDEALGVFRNYPHLAKIL